MGFFRIFRIKFLYAFLSTSPSPSPPSIAKSAASLIFLDFISKIIVFGKGYKLRSSSLCSFQWSLVNSSVLGQKSFSAHYFRRDSAYVFPLQSLSHTHVNLYPTAFPYGNGMVLHLYQQQESSTTKTEHKVINKGLKTYV